MAISGKMLRREDFRKGMDIMYVQRHINGDKIDFKTRKARVVDVLRVVALIRFEDDKVERQVRFNELALIDEGNGAAQEPKLRAVPPAFSSLPKGALDTSAAVRLPPIGAAVPARPVIPPAPVVTRPTVVVPPTKPHAVPPPVQKRPPTVPPPAAAKKAPDVQTFDEWLAQATSMYDALKTQKVALDADLERLMEQQVKLQEEMDVKMTEANTVMGRIAAIEKLRNPSGE